MNTKILCTAFALALAFTSSLPAWADAPVPISPHGGTFIGGAAPVPINLPAPAPVPTQK